MGTWAGGDPSKIEAILDPTGVISVYQGRSIPTGRKRTRTKGYAGYGDLDPTNTRWYKLIQGELDVSELDNDELQYGTTKCDDGKFSVRAAYQAAKMPPKVRNAIRRELMKRATHMMEGALLDATGRIIDIATSPLSDDKDAMKAAEWLIHRTMGKTPDVIVHTQEKPWEVLVSDISRGSREDSRVARGLESNPPLEAEIVLDPDDNEA